MKIVTTLDRRLAPAGEGATRYLRIQIIAPERPTTQRLPLNLALVIDRSGSMEGDKLQKAKEAGIFCLRNLTALDRASVVAYDDEVRLVAASSKLTPEVKAQLIADIQSLRTGGSTNLSGGWLTGAQEVANYMHEASYLNRAVLMSDGLANVGIIDTPALANHAAELRKRGVSTTTMGIGADFNEELMEQIAIMGGGHFYFVEHAKQIPDYLHRELGEVLATVARKVALNLTLPHGVQAELLNSFEMSKQESKLTVRVDDLVSGETRTVIFKLTLPTCSAGTVLPVVVTLDYEEVEAGQISSATNSEATITYAQKDKAELEEQNTSVAADAALLEVALAREQALRYDAAGDYAASAATLRSAAVYVQAAAPGSPVAQAEVAALQAESANAEHGLGGMARKAMHYAQSTARQSRQR